MVKGGKAVCRSTRCCFVCFSISTLAGRSGTRPRLLMRLRLLMPEKNSTKYRTRAPRSAQTPNQSINRLRAGMAADHLMSQSSVSSYLAAATTSTHSLFIHHTVPIRLAHRLLSLSYLSPRMNVYASVQPPVHSCNHSFIRPHRSRTKPLKLQ